MNRLPVTYRNSTEEYWPTWPRATMWERDPVGVNSWRRGRSWSLGRSLFYGGLSESSSADDVAVLRRCVRHEAPIVE